MQRLWGFSELKFIHACTRGMTIDRIAEELNTRFHEGRSIRTPMDVEQIRQKKTIFSFEDERRGRAFI